MRGYIFRCNDKTIDEVLLNNLLGEELAVWGSMEKITNDDIVFLYNTSTFQFVGPLYPDSECKKNINANAWKGKFPVQIKFKESENTKTISFTAIQNIIKKFRNTIYPWPELDEDQTKKILDILKQ